MEKEIYIKKGWLFIPVCATYGESAVWRQKKQPYA